MASKVELSLGEEEYIFRHRMECAQGCTDCRCKVWDCTPADAVSGDASQHFDMQHPGQNTGVHGTVFPEELLTHAGDPSKDRKAVQCPLEGASCLAWELGLTCDAQGLSSVDVVLLALKEAASLLGTWVVPNHSKLGLLKVSGWVQAQRLKVQLSSCVESHLICPAQVRGQRERSASPFTYLSF